MGTRGVTIVKSNHKTRVAQYGQWDHYPSGQGMTILKFLRSADLEKFKNQLEKCRFCDKEKNKEIDLFLKSIGSKYGWMSMEQAEKFNKKYPYLTRDHGAGVLELINESTDDVIWLRNSRSFIKDGLFCEYAYFVDLDKGTFEIYKGFNEDKTKIAPRFRKLKYKGEYCGPTLMKVYKINSLPDDETYLRETEPKEEEETE